jgi:tetratricopeptide (TPR) repeat protein
LFFTIALADETETNSPEQAFQQAWQKFVGGQFREAERIVDAYPAEALSNRHLQANFAYLEGFLLGKHSGREHEAISAFLDARHIYQELGAVQEVFHTNTGLAKIYMDQDRLAEAETILEENLELGNREGFPIGVTHSLIVELLFLRQAFHEALEHAHAAERAFRREGKISGVANSYSRQGLLLMLLGKWEDGHQATVRAQLRMVGKGRSYDYLFTQANLILYYRCNGLDEEPFVRAILAHLEENPDKDLEEFLYFVLSVDCGGDKAIGSIDPSQPPNPPPPPK